MKSMAKRYLAVLLSIIMIFSVTPISSYAAETASTYVQINTAEELTSGKYVMIVNSGYAVGAFDSATKWLAAVATSPVEGKVINPDQTLLWDVAVSGTSVTLTDSIGVTVKPAGGNNNGIAAGNYSWAVEFNNGAFYFKGTGIDTVILASNKGSENKFRAYKTTTVASGGANYSSAFTLYKLDSNDPPVSMKAETPKANIPSGNVVSGSAISLSSGTPDASIQYTTELPVTTSSAVSTATPTALWVKYTEPIIINSNTTIYAQAMAEGYEDSDIAEFNYVVVEEPGTDPNIYDPITEIPEGAQTVLETSQLAAGQVVTVVGQLVYRFGNYNTPNSAILEDVIDGKIYALQLYDALSDFKIGDVVKVTGTTDIYGGVPQVKSITAKELLISAADTQLIDAQEFTSISDLKTFKDSLLSEWVVLKGVTLGTYNSNGSTNVTDSTGNSIPIYRAATYPSGVTAGEKVDLYACVSKYTTTDQLRVGASSDYVVTKDTKAPVITMPTFDNAELGKDYKISITITDNVAVSEAELTYTVNQVSNKVALVQNTSDSTVWEATIPGTTFTSDVTKFTVFVSAKDKAANVAVSDVKDIFIVDVPQVIKVTPDRNENTGNEKRPLISITALNLGAAPTAKLTLKSGAEVKINAVPMSYSNGTFSYTPS